MSDGANGTTKHNLRSICVYCGSSDGRRPEYVEHAKKLGSIFAEENVQLVYGGGSVGIMGHLARTIHSLGGQVLGIIPQALKGIINLIIIDIKMTVDVSGEMIGKVKVTHSMHDRKALMCSSSDAFIALPGGMGTMEELVEITTWAQLRIHSKPIGLLNVNGFYDPFLAWIEKAKEEGFIDEHSAKIIVVRDTPDELVKALQDYQSPIQGPWILKEDDWKKRPPMPLEES